MSKEMEALKKIRRLLIKDYQYLVDDVEKVLERNEPMKVVIHGDLGAFECSNCIKNGVTDSMWLFEEIGEYAYCPRCGQRLDWSE